MIIKLLKSTECRLIFESNHLAVRLIHDQWYCSIFDIDNNIARVLTILKDWSVYIERIKHFYHCSFDMIRPFLKNIDSPQVGLIVAQIKYVITVARVLFSFFNHSSLKSLLMFLLFYYFFFSRKETVTPRAIVVLSSLPDTIFRSEMCKLLRSWFTFAVWLQTKRFDTNVDR